MSAFPAPGSNQPDDQDAADALWGGLKSNPVPIHKSFDDMSDEEIEEELQDEDD